MGSNLASERGLKLNGRGPGTLTTAETRLGLRISNGEAVASTVFQTLVSNAFLTGFVLAWSANDFHLGLLGAIPCFASLFQVAGA